MDKQTLQVGATLRLAAGIALIAALVTALAVFLWQIALVLLLVFAAVLVAILLRSLADWAARWTGFSARWALGLVLVTLTAAAIVAVVVLGPSVVDQMTELADEIPRSLENLKQELHERPWGDRMLKTLPESADDVPVSRKDATDYASNVASVFTSGFGALIVVSFLALYLAFDPETYIDGSLKLISPLKRARVRQTLNEAHDVLRWWLIGKIFAMALVGISTTLGLAALGVPLAIALGVVAALLTFVPNFGPIFSAIPAVLLGLMNSPMTAAYVAILYFAIQLVESYVISPLIQQRTASLPPALTITAQVAMGIVFGGPGVVLATPLAAAMIVVVKRLYVEDVLERPA